MPAHPRRSDDHPVVTSRRTVRVRVRGTLSERLAPAFAGMKFVRRSGDTDIVGEVVDQTQLHGLLTRVRDLGLELGAVTVTDADPTMSSDAGETRVAVLESKGAAKGGSKDR